MRTIIIATMAASQVNALHATQLAQMDEIKHTFVEWKQCKKEVKRVKGEKWPARFERMTKCMDTKIAAKLEELNADLATAEGDARKPIINSLISYQCRQDCRKSTGNGKKNKAKKNACLKECVVKSAAEWAAKEAVESEESEDEPTPVPVPSESEESEDVPTEESEEEPTPLPVVSEETEESDDEPTEPYDDSNKDGINSKDTNVWSQTLLEKINALREEADVAPLVYDQKIADITKDHNRSCTVSKRKSSADQAARLLAAGGDAVEIMGNNWNNGYAWKPAGSLEKLFSDWAANPTNKALMIDAKYTKAGLSVYNSSGCQFMSTMILTN